MKTRVNRAPSLGNEQGANHSKVLRSVASAASYNVMLQLAVRVFTFSINGFLLRRISRETIGVVNVRLTLYSSTCMFLAREALRKVCVEYKYTTWHTVSWLVWSSLPLGLLVVSAVGYVWVNFLEKPDDSMPNYESSVAFFAIATLLELACEPMWIFCHAHFLVGGRVLVEGASLLVRCIVTVVLVVVVPEWGLNIFGIAACVYASCLIVGWISYVRYQQSLTTHVPPLPVTTLAGLAPSTLTIDAETKKVVLLTFSFTKQSFLKQFLTEGERYVMTLFAVIDFGQQGVFDVVSNLGSLVARFLFQPIEESYYLFFTSILSRDETHESIPQEHSQNSIQLQQPPTRATWLGTNQEQPLAGVGVAEHTHTDTHPDSRQGQSNTFAQRKALAARALVTLLKFVGILGLVFVCFGPSYTTILLDMYGGQAISIGIGPALLSWYCLYVLVLGINGITECFLLASADRNTIEAYNRLMVGFSVVYLAASLTLTRTRLQAAGFIVANCLNMCLRIAYGLRHALQYFAPRTLTHPQATAHNTHPLYQAVPSFWLLCTLVASGLVTQVSHALLLSGEDDEAAAVSRGLYVARAEHVLVGVCMLLVTAVVFAVTEKRFINDLKQLWRGSLTADVSKIE